MWVKMNELIEDWFIGETGSADIFALLHVELQADFLTSCFDNLDISGHLFFVPAQCEVIHVPDLERTG